MRGLGNFHVCISVEEALRYARVRGVCFFLKSGFMATDSASSFRRRQSPNSSEKGDSKMYPTRSFRRFAFLALAMLTVYLGPASLTAESVESVFKGRFTLPFEAWWGDAVLPPGQYTLTLKSYVAPFTVTVRGGNRAALITTSISDRKFNASARNELVASRSGGKLRIRELKVAEAGVVFYYPLPKSGQRTTQVSDLIQRIPVGTAGK
jgi:hypothetical protein